MRTTTAARYRTPLPAHTHAHRTCARHAAFPFAVRGRTATTAPHCRPTFAAAPAPLQHYAIRFGCRLCRTACQHSLPHLCLLLHAPRCRTSAPHPACHTPPVYCTLPPAMPRTPQHYPAYLPAHGYTATHRLPHLPCLPRLPHIAFTSSHTWIHSFVFWNTIAIPQAPAFTSVLAKWVYHTFCTCQRGGYCRSFTHGLPIQTFITVLSHRSCVCCTVCRSILPI